MNRSALFFFPLWFMTATSQAASTKDAEVLAQAHSYQMEFRAGKTEVLGPLLKSLQDAVAQSPDNAKLWESLGNAYMAKQGSLYGPTLDVPALIDNGGHARDAYARSISLDPNGALARAGLGMSSMVVAQL